MSSYTKQSRKSYSFLVYLLILVLGSACSSGDSTLTTQKENKDGVPIPGVVSAALPENGTLSAYIRVDDSPRQLMDIVDGFATITLTGIAQGEHTITIEFEFELESNPGESIMLASASRVLNVRPGENQLDFDDAEFDTDFDSDGDGTSNLNELNNNTNPFAGITVSSISNNTSEDGATATFSVVLTTEPSATVSIGVSSSDTTEGTVNSALLTFNSSNWTIPQDVTVTGVDDDIADGDIGYSIITASASSNDANYNGLTPEDVSIINTDNDLAEFNVSAISGNTTETGVSATFSVALSSQPTADVTIAINSLDTGEGIADKPSLTFTATDWNVAQVVTVTGVDDSVADGNQTFLIQLASAVSSDTQFAGQNPPDVSVINIDDDSAGFNISPANGNTSEAGGTATFTAQLNTQPTSTVTINISSSDLTEGTVEQSAITFDASNWNIAQTVTVTGVDDNVKDGNQNYSIVLANAISNDSNYSNQNPNDVSIINLDNDFTITGSVAGYTGTGLVLQNNGDDDLPVSGSTFTFSGAIANGSAYSVTIQNQPAGQNCILENATGVVDNSNVTDIVVLCFSKVAALYSEGASWNDYIEDDGSDIFHAQGQACTSLSACFHAGILRKVSLPGASSCSQGDFTAEDDLTAFTWQCVDGTAGASMVSSGFNAGIRLYDLIDVSQGQWKSNAVTVYDNGVELAKTPASTDWWANTISMNPVANTELSNQSTIYIFTQNTYQSYSITADKVSVVTDPNITMFASDASAATLSAASHDFLWIEGNFDGIGANNGIHLTDVHSSAVRYVQVTAASQIPESAGLLLSSSHNNLIEESNFIRNRWSGIQFYFSNKNTLKNIEITGHDGIYGNPPIDPSGPGPGFWLRTSNENRVNGMKVNTHTSGVSIVTNSNRNRVTNINASNNRNDGVYVYLSQENVFDRVTTSNNGSHGINFVQGQYNIISQFTNNNSGTYGARFTNSSYSIFSYGTLANSLGYGFSFEDSSQNLLFGVSIVNNNYSGIKFFNSSNNTVGNIIIANNGNTAFPAGVNLYNSNNNYFTGIYKSGSNVDGDCFLSPDPVMINPGLNTDCTPNGASDFGAIVPITLADTTFAGKLTIVDQANTTIQQGGSALYANITDWNHFSNPYRGWGLNGGVFPDENQQGRCTAATVEPCRIWDWTLNSFDTIARQTLAEPDPLQVVQHPWVASGSITFLRNAVEISNDGRGNDNALCEPNNDEVCIAAYNIASDQGSGGLVDTTTAAMTAVGITMYAYSN